MLENDLNMPYPVIPLSRLLDESPIIQAVGITPSESAILQALKEYGTGFLEMQMKVINSGKHRQVSLSSSTYNIRRIDWETIREKKSTDEDSMSNSFWDRTIDDWNARTIYIVRLISTGDSFSILFLGVMITAPLTDKSLGKYTTQILDTAVCSVLCQRSHRNQECVGGCANRTNNGNKWIDPAHRDPASRTPSARQSFR